MRAPSPNNKAEKGNKSKKVKVNNNKTVAVAGDRTRVARVTGGNTHHYTTTTKLPHETCEAIWP